MILFLLEEIIPKPKVADKKSEGSKSNKLAKTSANKYRPNWRNNKNRKQTIKKGKG